MITTVCWVPLQPVLSSVPHTRSHAESTQQPYEEGTRIVLSLQMGKLRLSQVKAHAGGAGIGTYVFESPES